MERKMAIGVTERDQSMLWLNVIMWTLITDKADENIHNNPLLWPVMVKSSHFKFYLFLKKTKVWDDFIHVDLTQLFP